MSRLQPPIDVCAAILAGGKSTRMGRDKTSLLLGEERLLERLLSLLERTFAQVLQVGGLPPESWKSRIGWVQDPIEGRGPLAGLYAALLQSSHPWVFLCACDMPFIDERLVRSMAALRGEGEVVVPYVRGRYETLMAFYSKACLPIVEQHLGEGVLALNALYPHLQLRTVDEGELIRLGSDLRERDPFFNVNTPEDLLELESKTGLPARFP